MNAIPNTLSVVVPVHNAERNLTQRIGCLLDLLTDVAAKFEVLIVDDGSTDHTEDVAFELSQRYPQVRVARHPQQRGVEASARTGAAHTTGEIVIVHAGHEPVNASQLRRMWRHREDEELVVAPAGSHVGGVHPSVLRQLEEWGQGVTSRQRPATVQDEWQTRTETSRHIARGPKESLAPTRSFRLSPSDRPSSMHQ